MSNTLPVIIQSIIYRIEPSGPEILLMKRSAERGGFWSFVNGTLELDESAIVCRKREVLEETGIEALKDWSPELHRFSFPYNNQTFVTVAFAVEVTSAETVTINHEHSDFKWLNFDAADALLKFDDDKIGARRLKEWLTKRPLDSIKAYA